MPDQISGGEDPIWVKKLGRSFRFAGQGFRRVVREERNLRIHLTAVFYVCTAGFLHGLGGLEWAALCICFALVIGAELINTAIETLCDAVTTNPDRLIGAAKDVAAGAVLVCAVCSVGVAVAIFGHTEGWRQVWERLRGNPPLLVFLVATVPALILFVRGRKTWK